MSQLSKAPCSRGAKSVLFVVCVCVGNVIEHTYSSLKKGTSNLVVDSNGVLAII